MASADGHGGGEQIDPVALAERAKADANLLAQFNASIAQSDEMLRERGVPAQRARDIAFARSLLFLPEWNIVACAVKGEKDFFLGGRSLGRWLQFFLSFGNMTDPGQATTTASSVYRQGAGGAWLALITLFLTPYYWFMNVWFRRVRLTTMADLMQATDDPIAALAAYEQARLGPTSKVVRTNRATPPDFINIKVEELTGDKPFDNLDRFITQDELRALSDNYKQIAGFGRQDVI